MTNSLIRKIGRNSLDSLEYIKYPLVILGMLVLTARGCNNLFNNRLIETNSSKTYSHSTEIIGHNEYTQFKDSSVELKVYPGILGHRYASSKLYTDLNNDGKVDKIRISGPEWKLHRLNKILVRDYDYNSNKDEFDNADKLLYDEKLGYNKHDK
jgi:hypothetical protein